MASNQHTVHDTVTSGTSSADDTITSAAPPTATTNTYNNDSSTSTSTESESQLLSEIDQGQASVFSKDPEVQRRGSDILSRTPAPNVTPASQGATEESSGTSNTITSSVGQQSAPGRAGSVGEAVLGGFGYGGSQVERPKEEQGLGEKIVNLMGA